MAIYFLQILFGLSICVLNTTAMHPIQVMRLFAPNQDNFRPLSSMTSSDSKNQRCSKAIDSLIAHMPNDTMYLAKMLDASGKESGFLNGDTSWLGNFDECQNSPDLHYCLSTLKINISMPSQAPMVVAVRWGLCALKECDGNDVAGVIGTYMKALLVTVQSIQVEGVQVMCYTDPIMEYNTGFYVVIVITLLLCSLALVGTVIDVWMRYQLTLETKLAHMVNENGTEGSLNEASPLLISKASQASRDTRPSTNFLIKFLMCFSLPQNCSKLLSTKVSDKQLTCLNGIRVFSILWVILGHSYVFYLMSGLADNPVVVPDLLSKWPFQIVVNAYFSVDSFFFLSGLLVTYLTIAMLQKSEGKFPVLKFYFHRWWRLTPTMMFIILIFNNVLPFFGNGPIWQSSFAAQNQCGSYWWTNMLYINNFYPDSFMNECIGWSWYLANDMQFFVISPLFICLLYRSKKLGMIVLAAFIAACCIVTGALMIAYDLRSNNVSDLQKNIVEATGHNYMATVYIKPYCRISPYLIGMGLGYYLQEENRQTFLQTFMKLRLVRLFGWVIAIVLALVVLFGLNSLYHGHKQTLGEAVMYEAFSRLVWSLCLSWVVLMCFHGYGGWVDSILSWSFWIPLSRLTYTVYLLHPLIMMVDVFGLYHSVHLSHKNVVYRFLGWSFITHLCAFIMTLLLEFPLGNLEKLIFGRQRK